MIAGGLVVLLALPIFLIGGWSVRGWALGAVLWVGSQLFAVVLNRHGIGDPTLKGSGPVAFGMMGRGILVVLVAIVVAAAGSPDLAVAGILVYALAYTVELALSLTAYFSGGERR
jgi:hypothetical protein